MIGQNTPYSENEIIARFAKVTETDIALVKKFLDAGIFKIQTLRITLACCDLVGPLCKLDYTQQEKNRFLVERYSLSISVVHKLTSRYRKIYNYAKTV